MKKLFFLFVMCFMALTMQAQRCAVLEFNTGKGVSKEDTEGIFFIFNSNYYPEGYTVLERTQIDAVIDQLGYPKTGLSQQQILKIGRKLNASYIVVGVTRVYMGEYSLDTRVIDVATGVTVASEGTPFQRTSYRKNVECVAKKLARKTIQSR